MPSIRILSGKYKNRRLDFAVEKELRPTCHRLRQAVFNSMIHRFFSDRIGQDLPLAGVRVLDLFSGLGAYGFEALSLGAEHVTFVEKHFSTTRLIQAYATQLECLSQVKIICKIWPCSNLFLETFDLIFLDPPYSVEREFIGQSISACAPLIGESGLLILESPHFMSPIEPFFPVFSKKTGDVYITFFRKQDLVF